ncbi:hypothetical protein [Psychrobacillus sp. NPDC096623]|uniref:hypothetical protein n=1 Tax=Psychrobacillus sp. NPDC096623 TaxID=3364492 RepID=UPI0038281B56
MIKWNEELVVKANIEKVWSLFMDKNIHKIMDKVEDHVLIEKQENELGAKHRQSYREGKRVETYIVETLAYLDRPINSWISSNTGKLFISRKRSEAKVSLLLFSTCPLK